MHEQADRDRVEVGKIRGREVLGFPKKTAEIVLTRLRLRPTRLVREAER
jgi:hypothetical protein